MEHIPVFQTADSLPRLATTVIVAGGLAQIRYNYGQYSWFTNEEDPRFSVQLEWTPIWWAYLPSEN
jgi:hypothetical protein